MFRLTYMFTNVFAHHSFLNFRLCFWNHFLLPEIYVYKFLYWGSVVVNSVFVYLKCLFFFFWKGLYFTLVLKWLHTLCWQIFSQRIETVLFPVFWLLMLLLKSLLWYCFINNLSFFLSLVFHRFTMIWEFENFFKLFILFGIYYASCIFGFMSSISSGKIISHDLIKLCLSFYIYILSLWDCNWLY